MMIERELIFVYNANSGLFNGAMDVLHKVFSPKTYACHLCKVTYGIVGVDSDWKQFIEKSRVPFRFLHKDEWKLETDRSDEFPVVFERINDELNVIISSEKLNQMSLEELKSEIAFFIN